MGDFEEVLKAQCPDKYKDVKPEDVSSKCVNLLQVFRNVAIVQWLV